jgi:GT2 family glycosyltransferase
MILSIITANYNNSSSILSCLDSIVNNLKELDYEIIVVDNCSKDESCRLVREKYSNFHIIENIKNFGFARAINQGFKNTNGKYLMILNPDVKMASGLIEKLIKYMDDHSDVGLLLPKLINPDGSLQLSCRTFYNFSTLLFRKSPLGKIFPNHKVIRKHLLMDWNHEEVREVDWGLGACMIMRRNALTDGKILDDRFFLYFEDVDLCLRLKKAGWKIIYYPNVVMTHQHARQSARGFFNRAKWEHFKSLIKFYFKHKRFAL